MQEMHADYCADDSVAWVSQLICLSCGRLVLLICQMAPLRCSHYYIIIATCLSLNGIQTAVIWRNDSSANDVVALRVALQQLRCTALSISFCCYVERTTQITHVVYFYVYFLVEFLHIISESDLVFIKSDFGYFRLVLIFSLSV